MISFQIDFEEMLTALGVGGPPHEHEHVHTKRSAQHEGNTGRFVRAADHQHPNISEIENVTITVGCDLISSRNCEFINHFFY